MHALQDCTVLLHGPMQALHLHKLKNCLIQAGPVGGAIIGEEIDDCTLMVATHQLRLHHTRSTHVHVFCGSQPIIEHCTDVAFAPLLNLPYAGFSDSLRSSSLFKGENKWRQVLDFQCPGQTASRNWHVLGTVE
jgi:tubulin-specific chaperone C